MKRILLFAICLLTYTVSRAQGVQDTHPDAQIYAIDYQNGQQYPATTDQAIVFKDAFVDLVKNTYQSKQLLRYAIGRKTAVIKQINPKRLNGYQLTWQTTLLGQTSQVCTFYYNIDENALYLFDVNQQNWTPVQIDPNNQQNLEDCRQYCNFNSPQGYSNSGLPDLSELPDTTGEDINAEVTANEAPPALPEYDQPECPADGYMWQPGYWAYSPVAADYYWVPGVWVAPPSEGLYWTPGYWGYAGNVYVFHVGYWGHNVGFYGGINYGYGYGGVGYVGGEWRSGRFAYNTAVVHVNKVVIHNTYVNTTVINNTTIINNNRSSFNGRGGVVARPNAQEETAMRDHHIMATRDQIVHQQAALGNKDQFAGDNHGRPTVTTMSKVQPAALNKGTGPAVNPNNSNSAFRRQPVNGNNNQNSRPFGNNQPTNNNNGQQNTNHPFPGNRNTNTNQQPTNNGQQNGGFNNRNNANPSNNNTEQQQPTNNGQQNGSSNNREGRTPSNNNQQQNQQQPANNGQQNGGFNREGRNPSNTNQQQPVNNGQQNSGSNRNNNQQQPANNGQQGNGQQNHNNNQQPATNNAPNNNNSQQNKNQNSQPQPNTNGQQKHDGGKSFNNKPVNTSHQIKSQPRKVQKDDDK